MSHQRGEVCRERETLGRASQSLDERARAATFVLSSSSSRSPICASCDVVIAPLPAFRMGHTSL